MTTISSATRFPAVPARSEALGGGLHRLVLTAPLLAQRARPGQFVHLRVGSGADPLLRRPFSIHRVDRKKGLVFLLVREAGRGTRLLAEHPPRAVDLLGPLGRGFTLPERPSSVAVVSGGMGAAPLVFLLDELAGHDVRVYAGARSASFFPAREEMAGAGFCFMEATDDGSLGYHGTVTDLFRAEASRFRPDFTYACGPRAMLQSLCGVLADLGLAGEVSMESRMACGVGACQGCAVRVAGAYRLVCSDGPVFAAGDVEWDSATTRYSSSVRIF